jgi:hypothetical protein
MGNCIQTENKNEIKNVKLFKNSRSQLANDKYFMNLLNRVGRLVYKDEDISGIINYLECYVNENNDDVEIVELLKSFTKCKNELEFAYGSLSNIVAE